MSVDGVFGPFVAFLAGLLSFLSPCVLPLVPVYIAQIAGTTAAGGVAPSRRTTFLHAATFVVGFSAVFIALGVSAGGILAGGLRDHQQLFQTVAGAFIIVMGMQLTGLIRIPALYRTYSVPVAAGGGGGSVALGGPPRRAGLSYARSGLVGVGFAFGWTPCVGPVLGSILGLALTEGTVARAGLLLACYSLGLGVPFLVTGLAVGTVTASLKRVNRFLPLLEIASGALLILVGVLLVAHRMTMFNQYFDFFGIGAKGGL